MAYSKAKYLSWKSKGLSNKIALALADDAAAKVGVPAAAVADLAGTEDLAQVRTKVNALLTSLRDAGVIGS